MLKKTPFDFTLLVNALIKANPEEVHAALNNTLTQGDLYDALENSGKNLLQARSPLACILIINTCFVRWKYTASSGITYLHMASMTFPSTDYSAVR